MAGRIKKSSEGCARPCYELSPRSFDDLPKSFEQGRTPGPTTHTQMSSREDSTIRVAQVPGKRLLTLVKGV
jgi:hypothetical protein